MRFLPLLVALALPLAGANAPNPEAVKRGQLLFKASCGFCHGDDATGSRAPDLIRSTSVNHDVNGEVLAPIIRDGRPDKEMPGFAASLKNEQIADIIAFLHSQLLAALNSNRVTNDYPLEKLLTGNAAAGKAFFNGTGKCNECHSPSGDLAGVARKYTPIDLQSKMLYPGGARSTVTVVTASGQKFEGRLVHIDEFDVAMKDASGWYHSWARAKVKVDIHDPLAKHRELLGLLKDADVHNLFAYLETLK